MGAVSAMRSVGPVSAANVEYVPPELDVPRRCGYCEFWATPKPRSRFGYCGRTRNRGATESVVYPSAKFGCTEWERKQ